MKWYKPIPCDKHVKNPLVCDYTNIEEYGFKKSDFIAGKEITNWNNNIIFQAKNKKNGGNPDDALQNAEMLPIYSPRFIQAINSAKIEGIQFLPVNVLQPDGKSEEGFCIANFLNFVEALDYERSDYDRFADDFPNPNVRGEIAGIIKYVLLKDRIVEKDVIRLKDYPQSFFVSEKFKELFKRNKFTGYSFKEVELS